MLVNRTINLVRIAVTEKLNQRKKNFISIQVIKKKEAGVFLQLPFFIKVMFYIKA